MVDTSSSAAWFGLFALVSKCMALSITFSMMAACGVMMFIFFCLPFLK